MLCGVRKIPEPTTEPMTTITADVNPRRRAKVGSESVDSFVVIGSRTIWEKNGDASEAAKELF